MRRLNVQFSQIEECIRKSLFAIGGLPRDPPLRKGEELLLQLVKADADRLGKQNSRIEFALIYEDYEPDPTEELSRRHWPDAYGSTPAACGRSPRRGSGRRSTRPRNLAMPVAIESTYD